MLDHGQALPHLLPPSAYASEEHHRLELAQVLRPSWHCVATLSDFANPGDYRTIELLGRSLILHRTSRGMRAFVNACAHRHTQVSSLPCGNERRLRCQYHGWEYDAEGVACVIPDAGCFMPLDYQALRLEPVRLEQLGQLLFVCLEPASPPLRQSLGARATAALEAWFGPGVRQAAAIGLDHDCNWKIPVENSLEDYHVKMLHDNFIARHPKLFRLFQGRPPAGKPRYEIDDHFSSVHDEFGASSAGYRFALKALRKQSSVAFEHLHVFPSMLLGQTGLVTFFQSVLPTSVNRSRSLVRIFLDLGQAGTPLHERGLAPLADRLVAAMFRALMREDERVFPAAQSGMRDSTRNGLLSGREQRVYAFHRYLTSTLTRA
jgi:choline monooxygenase